MGKNLILIVEDEEDIAETLRIHLEREGYRAVAARSGEEALLTLNRMTVDLVLLDLMLPGIDGLEVCRAIKRNPAWTRIPVIIVSARGEDADVVAALELGAEDYVTKPFSLRVLVARIRSVLRRIRHPLPAEAAPLKIHELLIDPIRHEVGLGKERLDLTATEFQLLYFLARHPGWVFTRSQIVDAVKGPDYPVTDRSVDVQIVGLRRKLGRRASYIETIRGVGYRFKEPPA